RMQAIQHQAAQHRWMCGRASGTTHYRTSVQSNGSPAPMYDTRMADTAVFSYMTGKGYPDAAPKRFSKMY
ncbi:MAG: hypothetical protein Q9214_007433, partial [Letrouitia sp. 1 TL-2023]